MPSYQNEPIAVVGTGCRFPGESNTAAKLWELLRDPRDVSREIPSERFNVDRFYHSDSSHHGTSNVRRSYLLSEDVRMFDTKFFAIPPGEAEAMDPQHRLQLEVVYEAIESAGYTLESLSNSNTAVYVGLMCTDYYVIQAADLNFVPTYNATGVANSNASSRISYFFNWHGSSMTIDTACSSSLVAVNEAVQALRQGTSRAAVACGTNLLLSPLPYISESNLSMLSPTGRSRMWDAGADGYARGEGVAAVVLKTLSAAIEDGDTIECVIREIGVNQDGKTKGITMPSASAQAALIRETYSKAGLDPTTEEGRCQYFEGTNAHAILESYTPDRPVENGALATPSPSPIPFVFSAATRKSLRALLESFVTYLQDHETIDYDGLAYTLCSKRSVLHERLSVSASSASQLQERIQAKLDSASDGDADLGTTLSPATPSILGVFTGQGAQWATMGAKLISSAPLARATFETLDAALSGLPESHRPRWSLMRELLAESTSRVAEAELSQPLCTAVQIALVDLLKQAGIKFKSVIGHSSGEIAAAYAAELISAKDAIRIAYYRGYFSKLAVGSSGKQGGMMAVGTSFEDAKEFCELEEFNGALSVAAYNSPTSVTISGDREALETAQVVFQEEKRFYRALKVDTAYHSAHMIPCSAPYLEALQECQIKLLHPKSEAPQWFSSVQDGRLMARDESLKGQYWVDNMTKPVLFFPRNQELFRLFSLPEDQLRSTKLFRTQDGRFHDLLGVQTADGTAEEWRWRNVLKPKELTWLSGHALQGQTVFPGTGYIALAMEAALEIAKGKPVRSIDLVDLEIRKAIAITDHSSGTELLVSMTNVSPIHADVDAITANFSTFSTVSRESGSMALNCCGKVCINIGHDSSESFSPREAAALPLSAVDVERFYSAMRNDLGYMYDGPFKGLTKLYRRLGCSSGSIRRPDFNEKETTFVFHPGMLDNALQGLFAAYSAPGDGRLWSMRAPTACRRVTLIPSLCGRNITEEIDFDCTLTDPRDDFITGDVDVYSSGYGKKIIEIEGLSFSPFAAATANDDRSLFQESLWCVDKPDGPLVLGDRMPSAAERQKALDAERAAFFYLKELHLSVSHDNRGGLPWYRQALLDNAERLYDLVQSGKHPYAPKSWIDDHREDIVEMMSPYGDEDADFNLTTAVGEHLPLPSVLSGEANILEYMTKNNYLDRYYTNAIGFGWLNFLISGVVGQLSNKHPRMNFLEIGAGTGGATGAILDKIGQSYKSYTYTDISSGFFEKAAQKFQGHAHKMLFKTLDIEKDPAAQGFAENTYDVVVAANVLHATKSLKETLAHTRRLLKPGGYLVLMEILGNDVMRIGLVMGGLPGWWVGKQDGRRWGPTITLEEWDALFRQTDFSGVDTHTPMPDKIQMPGSVFVTQATEDTVNVLRDPLNSAPQPSEKPLVLIGGNKSAMCTLTEQIAGSLEPHFNQIIRVSSLQTLPEVPNGSHVLSLAECDDNLFENIDQATWENFKRLLSSPSSVLWVVRESRNKNPYAGITVGLFRSLYYELPEALLQVLDIGEDARGVEPGLIAKLMLQLKTGTQLQHGDAAALLWPVEPELVLDDGRFYAMRVRPHEGQNARYNSFRRPITQVKARDSASLKLEWHEKSYRLREVQEFATATPSDQVSVEVSCSLLSSVKTPAGYCFASLGTNTETGEKTLVLSNSQSSTITAPKDWTIPIKQDDVIDGQYMSFIVADLISQQILKMLPATGIILAYEPDPGLASLISKQLADRGRKIVFIGSQSEARMRNWRFLHPHCAKRVVDNAIPNGVSFYLDASSGPQGNNGLGSRIRSSLPELCEKWTLADLMAKTASSLPSQAPNTIAALLEKVTSFASSQLNSIPDGAPLSVLTLSEITAASASSTVAPISLVNWHIDTSVPVAIEPVSDRKDLFMPGHTYWLAGLSGDLGQSLADFIISHGADHVVLNSRSPRPNDDWVKFHKMNGATVAYLTGDLTSFESVKQMYDQIISTMPPLAGVANGALLLRDASLATMTLEQFQSVLGPKVQGSLNLERAVSAQEEGGEGRDAPAPLDWFIALSSIVGTTGNLGQAAYSAANCFMKALVQRRRAAGRAGSVVDISRVLGVGYVERETRSAGRLSKEQTERLMHRTGTLAMSEPDLHQLFAEAVVAGRPAASCSVTTATSPEIITGLAPITSDQAKNVFWAANPKFGMLIRDERVRPAAGSGAGGPAAIEIPVMKRLEAAKSTRDMNVVLVDSVIAKLRTALFLSTSDAVSETTALIDMGVDSLVGVEIRSWCLKELAVDVPVLKILGGASVVELVEDMMRSLPAELLSRFQKQQDQVAVPKKAVDEAPQPHTMIPAAA
ncbi:uncharacterized protein PG998_002756 [Apiospora kogelbergensis]|uniref:uncharacterized protein n=1 Tax=Apiospora kogelbergensis TaxID=1337665 RepID=UPI00312F78A3